MNVYCIIIVMGAGTMYGRVILTKNLDNDPDIELYSPVGSKTSFFQLQVGIIYCTAIM